MAKTSLWQSIAETLRTEIASGHFTPGDRLPTEAQLAARFGVNRHTVRAALADLATEGLVRSRRGSGVFVTLRPMDYPLGRRVRFNQNLRQAGIAPGRRISAITPRAADSDEAAALLLEPGAPVISCEGVALADDRPIAIYRSVFPAARLAGIAEALAQEDSVTRALASIGVTDYTRAETRISAITATPAQAALLEIAAGGALLLTEAINHSPDGTPIEHGISWFAGERVNLVLSDPD